MSCECDDLPIEGEKFYSAVDDLEVDFAAKLASGETMSSPTATVVAASNGVVGDLTLGTTGAGTLSVSGTKIIVRASAGKCGTQTGAYRWETVYLIRITATSSSGETPAGLIQLTVWDVIERA